MDWLSNVLYYLITMPDLFFLHSSHDPRCRVYMDKYFDGYFTLQFISGGAVELSYDERVYRLEGRWFWPHFPGPRTKLHPAPGHRFWEHRYAAFKGPLATRWAAEGLLLQEPQPAPHGKRDDREFDELLALLKRSDRWGLARAINQLERILLGLAEARAQERRRDPWLENVLTTFDEHPEYAFDYGRLAKESGMALSTFRRRFRQAAGTPLHTYALQCRTAAARKLLGETDLSIKQIAEQLGYNDVYFFSRQFRKQTGVPPGAYRKSRQS
jgi:AraC-like DNA-binding protein